MDVAKVRWYGQMVMEATGVHGLTIGNCEGNVLFDPGQLCNIFPSVSPDKLAVLLAGVVQRSCCCSLSLALATLLPLVSSSSCSTRPRRCTQTPHAHPHAPPHSTPPQTPHPQKTHASIRIHIGLCKRCEDPIRTYMNKQQGGGESPHSQTHTPRMLLRVQPLDAIHPIRHTMTPDTTIPTPTYRTRPRTYTDLLFDSC